MFHNPWERIDSLLNSNSNHVDQEISVGLKVVLNLVETYDFSQLLKLCNFE